MKFRRGFVSNSSSSSFVIVGFNVEVPCGVTKDTPQWAKDVYREMDSGFYDSLISVMNQTDVVHLKGKDDGLEENEHFLGKIVKQVRGTKIPDYTEEDVAEAKKIMEEVKKALRVDSDVIIKTGRRFLPI